MKVISEILNKSVGFLIHTKTIEIKERNLWYDNELKKLNKNLYLCKDSDIQKLQVLQNRAMRIILKCHKRTHITEMRNKLNWLSVKQTIMLNVLCLIFKIKNKLMPNYLNVNLSYVSDVYSNMSLRNSSNFRPQQYLSKNSQNNVFFKGVKEYNNIPQEIKNSATTEIFKLKCILYVKNKF